MLLGLRKGPSRNKWFRYRLQICVFSGFVIGWWSKLRAAHPYPTQSWVPPGSIWEWDPHQKELINKIEMVQKRAARFVTNTYDRSTSITAVIKDLEWDTPQNRRTANRLTILQKARQGLLALPMDQLLQPTRRPYPDSCPATKTSTNTHIFQT